MKYTRKNNLVLVESEHQLNSFMNYLLQYGGDNNRYDLIVRFNGELENDTRLMNRINTNEFNQVKLFTCARGSRRSLVKLLIESLYIRCNCITYSKLFLGDYRSKWMKTFRLINGFSKIMYLDDGSATLAFYKDLNSGKVKIGSPFSLITSLKIESTDIVDVLPLNLIQKKTKIIDGTILIIGMGLVEGGYMSERDYISAVKRIIKDHAGSNIEYIPHRIEGVSKLEVLEREFSIKVTKINSSIERYLTACDVVPQKIVSFYSTAIVSLPDLLKGPKYIAYFIKTEQLSEGIRQKVLDVYEHIEGKGIAIVGDGRD